MSTVQQLPTMANYHKCAIEFLPKEGYLGQITSYLDLEHGIGATICYKTPQ